MVTRSVYFTIPGNPQGKGRARSGANGQHYTPAKTRAYEQQVAIFGLQAMKGQPPINGPIHATLTVRLPIPKSWSAEKRAAARSGLLYPVSKPDNDNVEKAIFDGLNGICYDDDHHIFRNQTIKEYSDSPCVCVFLQEVKQWQPPAKKKSKE